MAATTTTGMQKTELKGLARMRNELNAAEKRKALYMLIVIVGLHIIGFGVFVAFVVPQHLKGLGIGVAGLAYALGLRHAFDADHISAIDNTTRKFMNEKKRPLTVGFFFSMGHSTIVIAIGAGLVIAEKAVYGAVSHNGSTLEQFGGLFGTCVSAAFLFLIAILNMIILAGIIKVFRAMRQGLYDEAELEKQLTNRGFFARYFSGWLKSITKPWQMYPVGVVFGMGFDTATEVALLGTTAFLASEALPWYSIMCLPVLFTAGMSLCDTADGCFMNFAYSWAFLNPVRKVFYNLAITGLSVFICVFIGAIELLQLLPQELHLSGGFWSVIAGFGINTAGFVIVGLFIAVWATALLIWRYGHIEEKWNAGMATALTRNPSLATDLGGIGSETGPGTGGGD